MTDVQVVPARAAVAAVAQTARNSDSAANTTFFAKESVTMHAKVGLLPPGVSAAAHGRGAQIPSPATGGESGRGAPPTLEFRAPVWCYQILFWAGRERAFGDEPQIPGPLDIPVWAVPATGAVHAVDVDTLVAELQPQFDVAKQIWKEEDAPLAAARTVFKAPKLAKGLLRTVTREMGSVIDDIRAIGDTVEDARPSPDRPTATQPPIEGVDYRTWMTVKAGLVRDAVHPTHVEVYAVHRDVPAGRWPAVDAAWQSRADADPGLGAWVTYDTQRLEPVGAAWGAEP